MMMTNTEFTIQRIWVQKCHLRKKSTALADLGQKIERATAEIERESAQAVTLLRFRTKVSSLNTSGSEMHFLILKEKQEHIPRESSEAK